jgi:hypothetical protein
MDNRRPPRVVAASGARKVEGFSSALLAFPCVFAAAPVNAQLSTTSLSGVVGRT